MIAALFLALRGKPGPFLIIAGRGREQLWLPVWFAQQHNVALSTPDEHVHGRMPDCVVAVGKGGIRFHVGDYFCRFPGNDVNGSVMILVLAAACDELGIAYRAAAHAVIVGWKRDWPGLLPGRVEPLHFFGI